MPRLFASSREIARATTSLLSIGFQSSAGTSALHVMSPREARASSVALEVRKPGTRKKGATSLALPRAFPTASMPLSISLPAWTSVILPKVKGWLKLCVPIVWPAAATFLASAGNVLAISPTMKNVAHQALQVEDKIGTMLPCNVIVQDVSGKAEVAAVDPVASMQAIQNPALEAIAVKVREELKAAVQAI